MPELPDVESIVRRIRPALTGRNIVHARALDRLLTSPSRLGALCGRRITGVRRRGKFIIIDAEGLSMLFHMRMTGNLFVTDEGPVDGHTRLLLELDNRKRLVFVDTRRLGTLKVVKTDTLKKLAEIRSLGPEPLEEDFTEERFIGMLRKRKGAIKSLLLNQHFIAGIGNIYGDEILFQSGIRPPRPAGEITEEEARRLFRVMRRVLAAAVKRDADLSGLRRWFVYTRGMGLCPRCRGKLEKVKIQGRYSWYCPDCQR